MSSAITEMGASKDHARKSRTDGRIEFIHAVGGESRCVKRMNPPHDSTDVIEERGIQLLYISGFEVQRASRHAKDLPVHGATVLIENPSIR